VSLRWRQAVLDLFLRAQLAVQAHLLLKVSIELRATKQHPKPSAECSEHVSCFHHFRR
jgi:hypothetical protein